MKTYTYPKKIDMYNLLYENGSYKETVLRNQPKTICMYERKLRIGTNNYNINKFKLEKV